MKIHVNVDKQKPEIVITHKDRELQFQANVFTRKPFMETDVYREINAYWAEQSDEFQDTLWEIYASADQAFDEIFNGTDLANTLKICIERIHQLHPLDQLKNWLVKNNVKIPASVKDLPPEANDVINTAEKTYTRSEYLDLIALALFLRTITPIWGEFIGSIRKDAGVDRKEYVGLQLFVGTGLLETRAMEKLSVYITKLTQGVHNDQNKIIADFSSEDIPFLHLALTCVRKICVADISGDDSVSQIVAVIFKFISYSMNSVDSSRIITKKESSGGGGGNEGEKHSLLETYRKRLELSVGELEEIQYVLSRPLLIVQYLEPDIPVDLVIQSMSTASVLKHEEVSDIQLHMAGWLIKPYITPKSIFYVDRDIHAPLLGALEALLWYRGHKYLAIMMSSSLLTNIEEIVISSISSREQIPPALKEQLFHWFPYYYGYAKKGRDVGTTERSDITTAIDFIIDEMINASFRATASEDRLIEVFGEVKRKLPIFSNVRTLLSEMMIDNERRISMLQKDPLENFVIPELY